MKWLNRQTEKTNDELRLQMIYKLFEAYGIENRHGGPHMNFWQSCVDLVYKAMIDFGSKPDLVFMATVAKPNKETVCNYIFTGFDRNLDKLKNTINVIMDSQNVMVADDEHDGGTMI